MIILAFQTGYLEVTGRKIYDELPEGVLTGDPTHPIDILLLVTSILRYYQLFGCVFMLATFVSSPFHSLKTSLVIAALRESRSNGLHRRLRNMQSSPYSRDTSHYRILLLTPHINPNQFLYAWNSNSKTK